MNEQMLIIPLRFFLPDDIKRQILKILDTLLINHCFSIFYTNYDPNTKYGFTYTRVFDDIFEIITGTPADKALYYMKDMKYFPMSSATPSL